MTDADARDVEVLKARLQPLWDEMVAINRRNGFLPWGARSRADNARWDDLYDEERRLEDEYDAAHPLPPCPLCGATISASTLHRWPRESTCPRIAQCPNAPEVMGG